MSADLRQSVTSTSSTTSPHRGVVVPKQIVSSCFSCDEPFFSESSKVHCFVCSCVYCKNCVTNSHVTASYGCLVPVPVCTRCRLNTTAVWALDNSADSCRGCGKKFTFFRRRHHCRRCGHLFCGKCSSQRQSVPFHFPTDGEETVRVCESCYKLDAISLNRSGGLLMADPSDDISAVWGTKARFALCSSSILREGEHQQQQQQSHSLQPQQPVVDEKDEKGE